MRGMESSRTFVAGWAELCNAHRFDEADRLVGPDGLVRPMRRMVASFPDWHWSVNRMVVEQDLVAVHMSATGTHLGEFLICEVRDQRVAKVWSGLDVAALRTQLESAAS
jgi:predicted ester cyclase